MQGNRGKHKSQAEGYCLEDTYTAASPQVAPVDEVGIMEVDWRVLESFSWTDEHSEQAQQWLPRDGGEW
jgi:hypothetical protein